MAEYNFGVQGSASKTIAEIYYFDYTGNMGIYHSYRNFCLENMVSFSVLIPGKTTRPISPVPSKKKVSEQSAREIQVFVSENLGNLTRIEEPKGYEVPEYFLVVYTDGMREYYQFDDEFSKIFEMKEVVEGSIDVLHTPYLVFEDKDYAKKIEIMDNIVTNLKGKKIRDILTYVSDDCVLEENYDQCNRIKTKKEIEKEIKKRIGFMGKKASKARIYATLEGSLNEYGESIVEIKIEASPQGGKEVVYLLSPIFNGNFEITNLNFSLFNANKRNTKTLWGNELERAKKGVYNDFKYKPISEEKLQQIADDIVKSIKEKYEKKI